MGRVAVRKAVASYIESLSVPYVGTVFPARPIIIEEQDYVENMWGQAVAESDNGSSCVVVVNMPSDHRERSGLVGQTNVDDSDAHDIVLELFFACTSGDGIAAQFDYDSIVDALVVGIRANGNLADPSVIWSAGEFSEGVNHEMGQPVTGPDGTTVLIAGHVSFQAYEWLAGPGGTA